MPIHETEQDLTRERAIADRIEQLWNVKLRKRSKLDRVDYDVLDHDETELRGVAEIKTRTRTYRDLEPVYFDARKWIALVETADELDVVGRVFFGFGDGEIRYIDASLIASTLIVTGRHDRGENERRAACYIRFPIANTFRLDP